MGWDELTAKRLARLQALGLAGDTQDPQPRPDWVIAWDELSHQQRTSRSRDMEIYAGMIDYMDESIGRILDYLRQSGQYDNTLIVFISDNGPSKTSIEDYLALGGANGEFFNNFNNSLDNKGQPGSSTDIGPGWAYAAATPLRLFKGYVAQGGIQVPAVIKLPGNMSNAGSRSNRLVSVMDLMPTFLAVADTAYPDVYKGEAVVPLHGQSLIPLLHGESSSVTQPRELGWSAYGMDAYRQGDWKVLRLPAPYGSGDWQLYNLANDPGEIHDIRSEYPLRAQSLAKAWEAYAEVNGIIQPNVATAYAKPITGRKF
jgi:arylsulfatase